MKRLLIAIVFGVVAGCICAAGGIAAGIFKLTALNLGWVFLNRSVMGFAIGISNLKVHWAWNGFLIGLIVGSIFSYSLFMDLGPKFLPFANFFVNGLFGLMIEFFTTVVFRQPAASARPHKQQAEVHA
jgi:hypothetical protein